MLCADFTADRTCLRPALAGLNRLFDRKLSETEFMICEEPDETLSRHEQLRMLLKASLSVDNLREETAAKAQAFEAIIRRWCVSDSWRSSLFR